MTLTQSIAEHLVDGDAQALFEEARRRRRRRWVLGVVIIVAVATVAWVSVTDGTTGRVAHRTSTAPHVATAPGSALFSESPDPPCRSSTPVGAVDAIDFVDADDGFGFTQVPSLATGSRVGDYDELVTTHDAGTTWVPVCPTSGPSVFSDGYLAINEMSDRTLYPSEDLLFTSPTTGFLWGPDGVARTTDGGTSWTPTLDGDIDGLAASPGAMWAAIDACPPVTDSGAGCHGDVQVSRDDGRSWRVVPDTASSGDIDAAVATGTTGTVVVADLHAIGHNTGPVPGLLRVTTDGGTSFRSRSFSCPPYATRVQVAVAGPANALWLTCWGGVAEYSWLAISRSADITDALVRASTIVDSPPSGFARNLPGVQPEQLVVTSATDATVLMGFTTPLTAPAGLYETDDGGQSWHATWPVTSLNGAFGGDVDFISATDGWATVPNDGPGVLLHTTDAGATWTTA